jgi:hypothetical protein
MVPRPGARVEATVVAALAISATLAGITGAAAATPAAAPATAGAALPDVVGLRPAIPAQQAYDFLKGYDRAARVFVSDTPLGMPPITPKPFPYLLALTQDPNNITEAIWVNITLPPSKATVWRVSRYTQFGAGQAPTVEKVMDSLRAKYGPEANLITPATGANNSRLTWYFDESGRRLERPGGLSPASCTGQLGPMDTPDNVAESHNLVYVLFQPLGDRQGVSECRAAVVVSAQLAQGTGPRNDRVVGRLRVTVADLPLEARAHEATLALIAKGAAAEVQQDKQREDKVAAPKL